MTRISGQKIVRKSQSGEILFSGSDPILLGPLPVVDTASVTSAGITTTNGTVTPSIPAGTVAGDLLLAFVGVRTTADPTVAGVSTPAGWTLFGSQSRGTSGRAWLFYKMATGGDAAPAFTIAGKPGNGPLQAAVVRVTGSSGLDAGATANLSLPAPAPQILTTQPNEVVLFFAMGAIAGAVGAFSWNAGTEVFDITQADATAAAVGTLGLDIVNQAVAGVSAQPTLSYTGTGATVFITVGVKPMP